MFGLSSGALLGRTIRHLEKPLTGLFLTAGLVLTAHSQVSADSATTSRASSNPASFLATETRTGQAVADGVYLYGQSPEPNQIGSAYMVFQVEQGQVEGAFYMPRSSFDCFYGSFQSDHLALTVINSYEKTHYPYAIALEPQDAVATIDDGTLPPVGLQGFHRLESPSENDLHILSTCQVSE